MMSQSQLEQKVREFCTNMIYIFIPDKTLKSGAFGKHTNRIYAKRQDQLDYLTGLSTEAGLAGKLDKVKSWIRDEMAKSFQPLYNPLTKKDETATPELVIYHLAQGHEVKGINWSAGIYGCRGRIGSTKPTGFGNNITVDPTSGTMFKSGVEVDTIANYSDKLTKNTNSYFDAATGNTYISKIDKKGNWYAYSVSDSAGNVNKVSGGKITLSDSTFWDNINDMLGQINKLASTIAEWLSGKTSEVLSPSQLGDGWVEPDNGGLFDANIGTLALLGAGAIAVGTVAGKSGKKGNKKSNTNTKDI